MSSSAGVLLDRKIDAVVARLEASRRKAPNGGPRFNPEADHDPHAYAQFGFSIHHPSRRFSRVSRAVNGADW